MGSEKAPVTIVEFADLECPACKATNQRVSEIRAKYGDDVQLVFMHFPLPQHHLAMISSRAIECADVRGRASALMDAVYSKQDSLGLKTWSSFGADAGIDSPSIFGECVAGSQAFPRIEAGLAVGKAAEVHGTPTFFVNGWRIRSDSLDIAVSMLLKGKQPYAKFKTRHL
jgi:protein-disulfide isomerase